MRKVTALRVLFAIGVAPLMFWTSFAKGQEYPTRPIKLVVPYAAGGTTDQVARILQSQLGKILGQQIIVDNKPGAAGAVGVDFVARAPADGYTLVFGNSGPNSIVPVIKKVPYDPIKDFKPVSIAVTVPMILAVTKSLPVNNVRELIAFAKSSAIPITYGSTGVGGYSHMTTEYFKSAAGIKATHIPYKGGAPGVLALRTGEIKMMFVTPVDGESQYRAGEIKYIGIASESRSELIPDVPVIGEVLPGFVSEAWFGVLAPAGTPDAIIEKLRLAINQAVADPAAKKAFSVLRVTAKTNTPKEFRETIQRELAHWANLVKGLDIVFE